MRQDSWDSWLEQSGGLACAGGSCLLWEPSGQWEPLENLLKRFESGKDVLLRTVSDAYLNFGDDLCRTQSRTGHARALFGFISHVCDVRRPKNPKLSTGYRSLFSRSVKLPSAVPPALLEGHGLGNSEAVGALEASVCPRNCLYRVWWGHEAATRGDRACIAA